MNEESHDSEDEQEVHTEPRLSKRIRVKIFWPKIFNLFVRK